MLKVTDAWEVWISITTPVRTRSEGPMVAAKPLRVSDHGSDPDGQCTATVAAGSGVVVAGGSVGVALADERVGSGVEVAGMGRVEVGASTEGEVTAAGTSAGAQAARVNAANSQLMAYFM